MKNRGRVVLNSPNPESKKKQRTNENEVHLRHDQSDSFYRTIDLKNNWLANPESFRFSENQHDIVYFLVSQPFGKVTRELHLRSG